MKQVITGVILATVAMYFWGFLYWGGANPFPYKSWKQTADDVAAGKALLEHFPETGTYYVPGMNHETEELEKLFETGPVAFVHITARNGRPMMDPSIMINGFVLNLVAASLLAILLKQVAAALPGYLNRMRFVALLGPCSSTVATQSGGRFPGNGKSTSRCMTSRQYSSPGWCWRSS